MKLNYKEVGQGKPLIILHGLFGSLDNWISIARKLEDRRRVFLVDQRNHGHSPHSNEFNYEVMTNDLKELAEKHRLQNIELVGHSMGGKTAMLFATKFSELVDKLVVVDIAPKYYPVHHDTIIKGLHAIDVHSITSRNEADERLSQHISDFGIRQFLLKNLKRVPDGFDWKINLEVIEREIEEVGKALPSNATYNGPALFIRGESSNYIQDEDMKLIQQHFPEANLSTVSNAGHWVHAEQPKALLELLIDFINS